jgi:hypothetical protein
MRPPMIQKILRIFIVVRDVEASLHTYEDQYGIGPWEFQDLSDAAVPKKWVRGEPCAYQVKIATCDTLNVGLALVQPLDDKSVFAEFLREKGPGVFHLLIESSDGLDAMVEFAASRDMPTLQRGRTVTGVEYAHIDFTHDLGVMLEMFKLPG